MGGRRDSDNTIKAQAPLSARQKGLVHGGREPCMESLVSPHPPFAQRAPRPPPAPHSRSAGFGEGVQRLKGVPPAPPVSAGRRAG